MRVPRKRVFRISLDGGDPYLEEAGERTCLETQHRFVTEKGYKTARVVELYLGGAKTKVIEEEEDEE